MEYTLKDAKTYIFSRHRGNRVLGAVLLFASVLLLFFNFIGVGTMAFFSMGLYSGFSPLTGFVASFALMSNGGSMAPIGLLYLCLFLTCLVLPILTGVMALVNRRFFSPLWACVIGIVHGVTWLVLVSIAMASADALGAIVPELSLDSAIMPTLWLFLYLGCMIVSLFLLRKEAVARKPEPLPFPIYSDDDPDPLAQTQVGSRPNHQGVRVQVYYIDDSGRHVVKRVIKPEWPLVIGRRLESNNHTVVLQDAHVSARHAQLTYDDLDGMVIHDMDSTNGVKVNGERIMRQCIITRDDTIRLGDSKLRFAVIGTLDDLYDNTPPAASVFLFEPVRVRLRFNDDAGSRAERIVIRDSVTIGCARDCDVQIDSLTVSRKHALLLNCGGGRVAIEDNASYNGVKVNGVLIDSATELKSGDEVTLGSVVIYIDLSWKSIY